MLGHAANHHGLTTVVCGQTVPQRSNSACLKVIKDHGVKERNVDAYDPETKTCYQYNGCRWHGCVKCAAGAGLEDHESLHAKTQETARILRESGYNVVEQWECADTTPGSYKEMYIHPRDALVGGHTDVNQCYLDTRGTELIIDYLDIVSLYPTVNALDVYPCGVPESYSYVQLCQQYCKQPDESCTGFIHRVLHTEGFCGFLKMDIQLNPMPIPVLPKRHDGKLYYSPTVRWWAAPYTQKR